MVGKNVIISESVAVALIETTDERDSYSLDPDFVVNQRIQAEQRQSHKG